MKDLFLVSKTKTSDKRVSVKVAIEVCGSETVTLTKPAILMNKM